MMTYLLVLIIFLFAFVGLGVGLLLKRKGLRGGCGHDPDARHECRCKDATPETLEETKRLGD